MNTTDHYSPHDLLPALEPCTTSPPTGYFYHNVAKHLIADTVRIMDNGLGIDLDRVEQLEEVLDVQLKKVADDLAANLLIQQFQKLQYKRAKGNYILDQTSKMKEASHFLRPFKHTDMMHRSYFMYLFAQQQGIGQTSDLLPTGVPKWPARTAKKLATTYPLITRLLAGNLKHPLVDEAMKLLSEHKRDIYNKSYKDKIENPVVELPPFNPASSKQKQELFAWQNIKSDAVSKETGLPKWDRAQVERVNKETGDDDVKHFTQCFIDHSFAAIVRNNFIEAFYKYTVDDRLYGNYKLLGAKSGRYTSNGPNMLNMPSTGSIFATPIKQCFIPRKDFLIAAIDYSALEDRVIASLSRDTNKCNIFLQDLDGHCLNAYGYFKEKIAAEMPLTGDTVTDVKAFFRLTEDNKILKKIRQDGKPATFGLSYGSYPPKVAETLKIPIKDAETIFNRYHNELYPGITEYREKYVMPTTKKHGKIHLGLGFYLSSDSPGKDIRTLNNATCQFWSILTGLAINKIHQLIDGAGLQNDIFVTSTIYDSIYFEIRDDATTIKWLNDNLVPIMTRDFMDNQTIGNTADLEIGHNWANLKLLHNNASLADIQQTIKAIHDKRAEDTA